MSSRSLILFSLLLLFLVSFKSDLSTLSKDAPEGYKKMGVVYCEGKYRQHLQGIALGNNSIYWSLTTELVRTDEKGKFLKKVEVPYHHGDLTHVDGKIYVAVGFGKWNHIDGLADSWVYVYDANDLSEVARHKTSEMVYGAGGIAFHKNRFLVVGRLPAQVDENYIYEYDRDFKFLKRHTVSSGHTHLGVQTIEFHDRLFWLGCYGDTKLITVDENFNVRGKDVFDASLGIASKSSKELWVSSNSGSDESGHSGFITIYKKK